MNLKTHIHTFKQFGNSWPARLVIAGCSVIACLYFLIVGLMIWKGDIWAYIVYAENPYAHFAGGLVFLLLGHILRVGDSYSARDWKLLAAKSVMLCFSLVTAFFIGEIGIRMILLKQQQAGSVERLREMKENKEDIPIRSTHPLAAIIELSDNMDLVYELQPNLDMEFGHKLLRTNSRGMRSDQEFTLEKPDKTIRIIGLGDSGMFGWNVHQGEEYMGVLQGNLNRRADGITYEVMNLAVPGYNTALEVESLAHKGLPLDPDIVILGWCVNDYKLPYFLLQNENFKRTDASFLMTYLFNRKEIIELVGGRKIRSLQDFDEEMVEDEIMDDAGDEGVMKAFIRLKELSEKEGFKVMAVGLLKKKERAMLKEAGIDFYTLLEIPKGTYPEEYALYFMHPRPGGHAVIAEKIETFLDDKGWLGNN